MYEQFWNLDRSPFENTHDSQFYFASQTHQSALLKMRYVVENRQGAALLVGGIGFGKSFLMNQLVHELPAAHDPVARIIYPQLSPPEMLRFIAAELGQDDHPVESGGLDQVIRFIEARLRNFTEQGRNPLIIIDDAQLILDQGVFQALQLLLNFRQHGGIEFSMIFVGERSLLPQLQRLRQLDERLAVKAVLQPLNHEETAQYVEHRLRTAGSTRTIFEESAIESLFELSGGIPRKINRLCDLSLLVGYADNLNSISSAEVEAVSEELTMAVSD